MENSNLSSVLLNYSKVLKECSNLINSGGKALYEDKRCRIYSLDSKEISIYQNGDLFIRFHETETSCTTEPKKSKYTYHHKYQDPLIQKSPFSYHKSNHSTPFKEQFVLSPQNQSCK